MLEAPMTRPPRSAQPPLTAHNLLVGIPKRHHIIHFTQRMAPRALPAIGLAVGFMAALCSWASAQTGCTPMTADLSPCVNYINGNMSAPPVTCCTQLDNLVQTQMGCLCAFLANGAPFNIPLNLAQVLSLPGACNIKAGPLSQCYGVATTPAGPSPVAPGPASPAMPSTPGSALAPSGTPATIPMTPSMPNTPSGAGSKTVPGGPVVGSSTRLGTHPLLFLLLVAITSYASSGVGF